MLKNAALFLVSLLISFAVLIGIIEVAGSYRYDNWKAEFPTKYDWFSTLTVASDNDILMWEYRPNSSAEATGTTISTNSFGFRDREHDLAPDPDKQRVVFVGDSITVGWGIDADETFVRLVEKEANQINPPKPLEVISLGVDGYNAVQVLELFRTRALEFSPDIVVYVLCMNDFDFERSSGDKIKFFRKPDNFFLRTVEKVYLKYSGVNFYEYYFNKNGETVFAEIQNASAHARQAGVDFRVAIMPVFEDDSAEYSLAQVHADIMARLARAGVASVDLLEPFTNQSNALVDFGTDGLHLNATGHAVVADYLARVLTGREPG